MSEESYAASLPRCIDVWDNDVKTHWVDDLDEIDFQPTLQSKADSDP